MYSEEKTIVMRVVENYFRTGNAQDDHQVKVINLPQGKSSYVEQIGVDGRSVMLNEYRLDGKIIRAGYSARSETVYLSPING